MGLLAEIYSVFGLGYTIALVKLKHDDFSRSDKAFIAATVVFLVLSIGNLFNKVRVIPSGYKCIFAGKSLLRGLLGPLLSLLYYPVLFYSKDCVKWALTFSNEAHDGVERTRQLKIFELVEFGSRARRYLTTHSLFWYGKEKKWGYDRLVGEIWVTVRFEAQFNVDTSRKLQTSDLGKKLLLQYERDTASQQGPEPILEISTGSVHVPKAEHESVKVSCLDCICVDLESGSNRANPGTPPTPPTPTPQPPITSQNPPPPSTSPPPPTPQPPPSSQNPPPPPTPQPPPTSQNSQPPPTPPTSQPPITSQNPPPPPTPPNPQPPPTSQNSQPPPTPQPPPTSQNPPTPQSPPTSQNPPTPQPPPTPQSPPTPPTSQNPPEQYTVTITRRRAICRIQRGECWLCPGFTWNLSSRVVEKWTLFQIHQYMLCLDVWGNHPKQGIWKPHEPNSKTCCLGDTSCCNAFTRIKRTLLSCLPGQRSTNQPENNQASRKTKFRYCFRHDELIDAILNNKRVTSRPNDATWYTVV